MTAQVDFEDVTEIEDIITTARTTLQLDADSPTSTVYSKGFEVVLQLIGQQIGKKNPKKAQKLRLSVLREIDLTQEDEETYNLAHRVGASYLMHGQLKDAETTLTLALGGLNKNSNKNKNKNKNNAAHGGGELHPDALKVCGTLGTVYERTGDYKKAIALASRLLKAQEEQFGATHRDTLHSVTNVAGLLLHVGDTQQAEDLYVRAKEALEVLCAEISKNTDDDLDYLTCLGNYAILLEKKTQNVDSQQLALSYYKRALRGKEKLLGKSNPDTLRSLSNLGMLLEAQGEVAEAEQMFTTCLEHRTATLGKNHAETLSSLASVAGCMLKTERGKKACELYKQVVVGYSSSISPTSPMTIKSIADLAYALMSTGQMEEALEMYKQVTGLRLAIHGGSHPKTLKSFFDTGILLFQLGQNEESIKMLRAALSGYETGGMTEEATQCQGLIEHIEEASKQEK